MMTLEYLREYRSYFHVGASWGVHESNACRIIKRTENLLVKAQEFRLPGKKALWIEELSPNSVVIDVTENEIERPKKGKKSTFQAKPKDMSSKHKPLAS